MVACREGPPWLDVIVAPGILPDARHGSVATPARYGSGPVLRAATTASPHVRAPGPRGAATDVGMTRSRGARPAGSRPDRPGSRPDRPGSRSDRLGRPGGAWRAPELSSPQASRSSARGAGSVIRAAGARRPACASRTSATATSYPWLIRRESEQSVTAHGRSGATAVPPRPLPEATAGPRGATPDAPLNPLIRIRCRPGSIGAPNATGSPVARRSRAGAPRISAVPAPSAATFSPFPRGVVPHTPVQG